MMHELTGKLLAGGRQRFARLRISFLLCCTALMVSSGRIAAARDHTLQDAMQAAGLDGVAPSASAWENYLDGILGIGARTWKEILCLIVLGILGMFCGWVRATGNWKIDDALIAGLTMPAAFEGVRLVSGALTGYVPGPALTNWLALGVSGVFITHHYLTKW